jgi:hypothetical protein
LERKMKYFGTFFFVQVMNYACLTWNYRAVAQAGYAHVVVSDLCCATISFTLIKIVSEAKCNAARAGYILGGACGSLVSVFVTKAVFGQ